MKHLINLSIALLLLNSCAAQDLTSTRGIKHAQSITVRVDGDCPMCEKTIEAVAFRKGEAAADWDVDAKTARITVDTTRTTVDAVLRRIAEAGYDNERYLAPDNAYKGLPGCCQYERGMKHEPVKGDAHEQHKADAHDGHGQKAQEPIAQEMSALEALFARYFELKDALVAGNGDAAKQVAATMGEVLHRMDPTKLTAAQQATWEQLINEAMPLLHPLSETTDLARQRKLFAQLTAPMLQLAEAVVEGTIYLDHCPMYEGGADWLSRDKAIKNPFYGSMMLTCGSVTRTIAK